MLLDIPPLLAEEIEVVKILASIDEIVVSMKNINSFMRMSINRCIDYTKASNGLILVPRFETVNFREALQMSINCMRNLQDGKSIELLPISSEISKLMILDLQWFQENVLCLLSNAVKYSCEGVVSISVTLMKNEEPTMLRIEVVDDGIGIADDVKPLLFTAFRQAQRMTGGTGLGLFALAKRMEAIGGKYGVENRKDDQNGTIFWFSIPYRPDLTPDSPGCRSNSSLNTIEQGVYKQNLPSLPQENIKCNPFDSPRKCDPLNILIVDDSISILKMSKKMVSRLGHTVTTAENGAVALKLLKSTFMTMSVGSAKVESTELLPKFDIVLMDLQMPIMDGLEATKRLRALENVVNLSSDNKIHQLIIGVSANSDHMTIEEAFTTGMDDFIPKPFNVESFEEVVKKLMNRKGG